jgi:hypothetical protein
VLNDVTELSDKKACSLTYSMQWQARTPEIAERLKAMTSNIAAPVKQVLYSFAENQLLCCMWLACCLVVFLPVRAAFVVLSLFDAVCKTVFALHPQCSFARS